MGDPLDQRSGWRMVHLFNRSVAPRINGKRTRIPLRSVGMHAWNDCELGKHAGIATHSLRRGHALDRYGVERRVAASEFEDFQWSSPAIRGYRVGRRTPTAASRAAGRLRARINPAIKSAMETQRAKPGLTGHDVRPDARLVDSRRRPDAAVRCPTP